MHKKAKHLCDLLVRSKLTPITEESTQTRRAITTCTNCRCQYCHLLNEEGHIMATITGRKIHTKHNVTCNSNNLVYCITCRRCKKQYVGQTKNSLKQRFQGHFYQIVHDGEKTEVTFQPILTPRSEGYGNPHTRLHTPQHHKECHPGDKTRT